MPTLGQCPDAELVGRIDLVLRNPSTNGVSPIARGRGTREALGANRSFRPPVVFSMLCTWTVLTQNLA